MELRDPVCSISHLVTAIWALYAAAILYRLTPPMPGRRLAVLGYGASMIFLYCSSALFHGVPITLDQDPTAFRFFQRLDQSAVFVYIAGTNTPIIMTLLRGGLQVGILRGIWGLAIAAVGCLWFLPHAPYIVIVGLCIGIGLLGLLPLRHYLRAIPWANSSWAWAGVALYGAAATCEVLDWPHVTEQPFRIGSHEVFHILVSAATIAFFVFMLRHVINYRELPALKTVLNTDERHIPVKQLLVTRYSRRMRRSRELIAIG